MLDDDYLVGSYFKEAFREFSGKHQHVCIENLHPHGHILYLLLLAVLRITSS